MNIYIIRHGETDMNVANRLQGRLDTLLNQKGKSDATNTFSILEEKGIRIDEVWASPLQRTVETGERASGIDRSDVRFKMEKRLLEVDFGPYEGSPISEDPTHYTHAFFSDPANVVAPAGVESMQELMERAKNFLEELFQYYIEHKDEDRNLLLVSHGGFTHAITCNILKMPLSDFWSFDVRNCSVTELVPGENGFVNCEPVFEGFKRKNMRKF